MRFKYCRDIFPPSLCLEVEVFPIERKESRQCRAKVDTAADRSVIPESIRLALELLPQGYVFARGIFDEEGQEKMVRTYFIKLGIPNFRTFELEVVSSPRKYALIGRDVLNKILLVANGPQGWFELSKVSD